MRKSSVALIPHPALRPGVFSPTFGSDMSLFPVETFLVIISYFNPDIKILTIKQLVLNYLWTPHCAPVRQLIFYCLLTPEMKEITSFLLDS